MSVFTWQPFFSSETYKKNFEIFFFSTSYFCKTTLMSTSLVSVERFEIKKKEQKNVLFLQKYNFSKFFDQFIFSNDLLSISSFLCNFWNRSNLLQKIKIVSSWKIEKIDSVYCQSPTSIIFCGLNTPSYWIIDHLHDFKKNCSAIKILKKKSTSNIASRLYGK